MFCLSYVPILSLCRVFLFCCVFCEVFRRVQPAQARVGSLSSLQPLRGGCGRARLQQPLRDRCGRFPDAAAASRPLLARLTSPPLFKMHWGVWGSPNVLVYLRCGTYISYFVLSADFCFSSRSLSGCVLWAF